MITLSGQNIGFKHSIEEQWTGEYWIDGFKIYTKSFSGDGRDVAGGVTRINSGISAASNVWIDPQMTFMYCLSDGRSYNAVIPNVASKGVIAAAADYQANIYFDVRTKEIVVEWGKSVKLNRYFVTILYVKT